MFSLMVADLQSHLPVMPLGSLLLDGVDGRSVPDAMGLCRSGAAMRPRSALPLGSCTASSPSLLAYAAAERARECLLVRGRGSIEERLDAAFSAVRRDLARVLRLENVPGTDVILCPSGTDAEYLTLALARAGDRRGLCNLVVGADEVGSGTCQAAGGRYFDVRTPGGERRVGEVLSAELADGVRVESVALRGADGLARACSAIDVEVTERVSRAVAGGERVLLHVVVHSKTGLSAPSEAAVSRLVARHAGSIAVVVDAAQGRIGRGSLARLLARGFFVLLTGSKFYGGMPFSGALLVPAARVPPPGFCFPDGLSDFLGRALLPPSWSAARAALPERSSIGLLLRWRAALAEMQAYHAVPATVRDAVLAHFEREAPRALALVPGLELCRPAWPLTGADAEARPLERRSTVFSFEVHPPGGRGPLDFDALLRVARALNIGDPAAADPRHYHVGQPVRLGHGGRAALRVAIGAPLVTQVANDPQFGAELEQRLGWLTDALRGLSRALERQLQLHQAKLGAE